MAASVLSLSSITVDIIYAVAKSTREIAPYKGMVGVDTALDVARDDALEDWCNACTFRMNKSQGWFGGRKPYADTQKELAELEKAFKAVSE